MASHLGVQLPASAPSPRALKAVSAGHKKNRAQNEPSPACDCGKSTVFRTVCTPLHVHSSEPPNRELPLRRNRNVNGNVDKLQQRTFYSLLHCLDPSIVVAQQRAGQLHPRTAPVQAARTPAQFGTVRACLYGRTGLSSTLSMN